MAKAGRPSTFTQEIAQTICDRLASGDSLRKICSDDDMPDRVTANRWMAKIPEFAASIASAREDQSEYMFDKINDISEQVLEGLVDSNAARVAIAALQWTAGKLKPKKYGDRLPDTIPQITNNMIITSQILDMLGKEQLESLRLKLSSTVSPETKVIDHVAD